MKKTLIALAALAGIAAADTTVYELGDTFTLDFGYAVSATGELAGSTVVDTLANNGTYVTMNKLAHKGFSTTLNLEKLLGYADIPEIQAGHRLELTSIQVVSRPDTNERPADATISLGAGLGTSDVADYSALVGSNRGLITFNFETPVDITTLTELTLTFNSESAKGFGYTCVNAPKAGYELVGETATFTSGANSYYMPLRLNVQIAPEPATATLSLLALAGLASRRRRH